MAKAKTLVFLPTYNESGNVEKIWAQILSLGLDADVLFVDDNSPDGTGMMLDALARLHPHVNVIHRAGKLGVGSAHREAIGWAYERGYAVLVTMDCDFSHQPGAMLDFLAGPEDAAVVVGSRFLRAESLSEWNLYRWCLTQLGHLLTRLLLKMPYDATGAYRLYRLDRIPRGIFDEVEADGYSFFFESLYRLHSRSVPISEIPITLPARHYGSSKMTLADIIRGVASLLRLWLAGRPRDS